MNRLTIIGNLTNDPEMRSTPDGKNVCNFSVAVNRRKKPNGQQETDFFRVSAWNNIAESCAKYLSKGRKVAVEGSVSGYAYKDKEGNPKASLEVTASDVEFLSSGNVDKATGYMKVDEEVPY